MSMSLSGARKRPGFSIGGIIALSASSFSVGSSPLDYMLRVMRDENEPPERRMEMAIAAAPYCHRELKQIEVGGKQDAPIEAKVHLSFD